MAHLPAVVLFRDTDMCGGGGWSGPARRYPMRLKDGYPIFFLSDGKLKSLVIPAHLTDRFIFSFGHREDITPEEIVKWVGEQKI
jgi:hypothetical protein